MAPALLEPPLALLRPWRIPAKFGLVALMFLLSAAMPTVFMVTNQNRELSHLGAERRGVAFLDALYALTEHAFRARMAGRNQLDGDARALDNGPSPGQLEVSVEADLAALKGLDDRFGAELGTRARVAALAEGWRKALAEKEPRAHLAALSAFMEELLALNASVVDASGLIVDADLACFYVINVGTVELPRQAAALLALSRAAQDAAAGGPLTDLRREDLQRQAGAIHFRLEAIRGMLSEAKGFSRPEVAGPLGVRLADHLKLSGAFLAQVGAGVLGPRILVPQPALRYAGREAVLSAFAFQAAAMRVLEELLAQRIRHFRLEQRLGLGGSLLASLLAFYLLAALYHGLKDGLARMEERLKALGAGDLTREVQVGTRDELQVLAQDLNQAMGGLRTLAAGLREGTAVVQAASAEAAEWSGRLSAMTASQIDEVDHAAYSVSALAPSAARARQEATAASQAAERVDAGLRSLQEAGLRAAQVMDGLKASAVQVARIAEGMEALAFQAKLVAAGALGRLEEGGRTPGVSDLIAELHGLGVRGAAAAQDLRASLLEGAALNAQGGAALAAALDAAHRVRPDFGAVTAFVREVGDAAQTLAERLGELGEILARIGGLTGDHADQARQLGASARTLAEQAQSLSGLAEHFRL